jgi:hypothetical protein
MKRSFTIGGLVAALMFAVASPASAGSPPLTVTEVHHKETFVDADVNPCTGEPGVVTTVVNAVFHITVFPDGRSHFTGTATGTFQFDTTDPAAPDYSGRVTQWFGENSNSNVSTATVTFSVRGIGTDGSTIRFHETVHLSIVGGDVVAVFDKIRCG